MKHSIVFALLLLSAVCHAHEFPKVKLGVVGGANVSQMVDKKGYLQVSNRTGYTAGVTSRIVFPFTGFGAEASLLFDHRWAKALSPGLVGGPIYYTALKVSELSLPVSLRYDVSHRRPLGLYFYGGPELGVNVGNRDYVDSDYGEWKPKKLFLSLNAGAGITLRGHWQLSASYNFVCTKTADVVINRMWGDPKRVGHLRLHAARLTLAYFF